MTIITKPKNFCTIPFTNFEIEASGRCNICCKRIDQITNSNGIAYNVKDTPITEIWNSEYMNTLRQQFIDNEQPDECSKCYTDEAVSGKSYRLEKYNEEVDFINPVVTDLVLKLSNLCNQACVTCSPLDSSLWQAEFVKNKIPLISVGITDELEFLYRQDKFNDDNLPALYDIAKNLKFLHVRGGEPTIHKELHRYIEHIANAGYASNISLVMNTNGMAYNPKFIEHCSKFKSAAILLSIDNVDSALEYMRWPAKWNKIHENMLQYSVLPIPFYIGINMTMSVLNILDLEKTLDKFSEYNVRVWMDNSIVYGPQILSMRNMPQYLKEHAVSKLQKIDFKKYKSYHILEKEKDSLINFIQLPPDHGMEFASNEDYTAALDKFLTPLDASRNIHFKECLPELYNLLHP